MTSTSSTLPVGPEHAAAPGREPVADAARLAGLINALLLAVGGVPATIVAALSSPEGWQAVAGAVGSVITAGLMLAVFLVSRRTAATAREQVTPLIDPRDADGRRLVPAAASGAADRELHDAIEGLIASVSELLAQAGGDHSAVTVHLTGRTQTPEDVAARVRAAGQPR